MADKYKENHTIACYEADANQLLKPIAMLDWMQEIAGRDATKLGFGYDNLIQNNTAWVLSRTHVRLVNYDAEVLLGEEVKLYSIYQDTDEGLVVYIQGMVEEKTKFSVKLVF